MLKKSNRANTKTVEQIFKEGLFFNTPTLTFRFIKKNQPSSPAISFVAPKSITKSAVKRNTLRRRGCKVLANHINQFPQGLFGVLVFRKAEVTSDTIEQDLETFLSKI